MLLGDAEVAQAETILIAVSDGVLADSLRFSLELEGFDIRFCDEHSLPALMSAPCVRGACLVLDQDVFTEVLKRQESGLFADCGLPVILLASHKTDRVLARAEAAGITHVVEKPLLGGILLKTIRQILDGKGCPGSAVHPSRLSDRPPPT